MTGKYVIVQALDIEQAIIFPGSVSHDFAVNVQKAKPVAAGFFRLNGADVEVEGASNTLCLSSRPQDAEIISRSLFFAGINLQRGATADLSEAATTSAGV